MENEKHSFLALRYEKQKKLLKQSHDTHIYTLHVHYVHISSSFETFYYPNSNKNTLIITISRAPSLSKEQVIRTLFTKKTSVIFAGI